MPLSLKSIGLLLCLSLFATSAPLFAETNPKDPWEGFNRKMFAFNSVFDDYLLRPLAVGYRTVTPDLAEQGVDNVFSNLREITNVFNDILQWKWGQAANDTTRFVINSTVGMAGLFDVAGRIGLERNHGEDFGQTLTAWGVSDGPYLMLPFLGPSTVTRTIGMPLDLDTLPIYQIENIAVRNSVVGLRLIAQRAQFLPLEENLSGDKYTFIRDAYLQRRNFLINDGEVEDDFGGESEEYGDYDL